MSGCAGVYEESMGDGRVWTAPDAMASEVEVGEFLYGLIRLFKPQRLVETGSYLFHTSDKICKAIIANGGFAEFYTCDIKRPDAEVPEGAIFWICTGENMISKVEDIDLAFLDSSGDRLAEAKALQMKPGGIVVLHDARRPVKEAIERELGWKSIFIPTPRGLALFQVP